MELYCQFALKFILQPWAAPLHGLHRLNTQHAHTTPADAPKQQLRQIYCA